LTWAIYLLSLHPRYQTALRHEIRTSVPSPLETNDTAPSPTDIDSLPLLNAICNETLRLYPTVPVTIRESVRPTTLAGTPIPVGTIVLLVPWAINRNPHFWGDNAHEFVPERWIGEGKANTGGAASNYAQITFLHGPRSCIGQGFARSEFKCLLAVVAARLSWELRGPGEEVYPAGVVTTKPKNGMHIRVRAVEGW
jgi:cytochrome P450